MPFPDNMDLGEGFRAVCLHLTALSVHPGRKQGSRQAEPGSAEDRPVLVVLVGQGGRNSAEAPQADRLWLRGGGVWSSLVCTVDKGGTLPPTPSQGNSPPTTRTWKSRQVVNRRKSCYWLTGPPG